MMTESLALADLCGLIKAAPLSQTVMDTLTQFTLGEISRIEAYRVLVGWRDTNPEMLGGAFDQTVCFVARWGLL